MQFKDIVNRDIVNLTNCEHEPIHIPGSIQPHGFLLGLKNPDFVIDFCSSNSFDFIGITHDQLLGRRFNIVFGEHELNRFTKYIASAERNSTAPLYFEFAGKHFSCIIHTSPAIYLFEFEPAPTENIEVSDVYRQTRQFIAYMENASTLQSLCQAVADETRAITGYDRVMIYRFDENYNGEVFAESCQESLEPFLGLHYPHTDIPVQARELYIKNLLRLIADVNYTPVPIYTIDDAPGKNLDLSHSVLRSVSPIHIQYLQNMGVGATLTISLIHQKKLWGLIACHHYSPKYISMHTRIAAQLQGHFLTSQIFVRQDSEEYVVAKKVNTALDNLLVKVFSSESISFKNLVDQQDLLTLANASGVIVIVDDEIYTTGNVPTEEETRKLANWLKISNLPTGFSTDKLVTIYADGFKCSQASGIIYHSLSANNDCIIWCRAEALQEVHWAGDPAKAIVKDKKGLSPRKSFELWKEVKKCESLPWQKPELAAAASLANALQKHVHMLFLTKEELKQRKLSEKLIAANAELENMNWIGSHDLKEPLRKIQLFASRILDDEHEKSYQFVTNSVQRMSESAKRMQLLINDIMSYSQVAHVQEVFVDVDLNILVKEVIEDLKFEISEKKALVTYKSLPIIKGTPFLLKQLFLNLIRNGLKFQETNAIPQITIQAKDGNEASNNSSFPQKFHNIIVHDNGIGFNEEYKESIFKVFSRFHQNSEYTGTGIGLALCKKIMQNHSGFITAESSPGAGTSFILSFPV